MPDNISTPDGGLPPYSDTPGRTSTGFTGGSVPRPPFQPNSERRSRYGPDYRPWRNGEQPTDASQLRAAAEILNEATSRSQQWASALVDPRRNIEDECGLPRLEDFISIDLYRMLYDRKSIPQRVVQVLAKETWQVNPGVAEDPDGSKETDFDEGWANVTVDMHDGTSWYEGEKGNLIWDYCERGDILSGIGHFGILLLGIDDGRNLADPIDGVTVVNRKAKPVYRRRKSPQAGNLFTTNSSEPNLIRNADGAPRQVGTRMEAVSRRRLMPDSYWAAEDEATLTAPLRTTRVDAKLGFVGGTRPAPALNAAEQQQVAKWRAQRDWAKAQAEAYNAPSGPWGDMPGALAHAVWVANHDRRAQPLTNAGGSRPENSDKIKTPDSNLLAAIGPVTVNVADQDNPSGPPRTLTLNKVSPNAKIDPTTGYSTDSQYGFMGAMPPAALSGTEQQYFGVQFGPSEAWDDKPSKKRHRLIFLRAFDESLVQVVRYEWNIRNPRFGRPVMYRVTLNDPRELHSGVGLPMATVFVHWSRVIHLADNLQSSEIFGTPRMRPVLDHLLGLNKLYCAAPEMYWRGAMPGYSIESNPQLGGDVPVNMAATQSMIEQYMNGLQRYLINVGMTVKSLAPQVVDPSPQIATQLEAVCIHIPCPVRVFKGSERGELASQQDDDHWLDVVRGRQNGYATPRIVCPLVDRLIQCGVLPEPESYTVRWPDLESLGDKDKAGIALTLTQAMQAYVTGSVEQIYPLQKYLTNILNRDSDEVDEIMDENEQAAQEQQEEQEQQEQDQQDLADEQGFEPAPPPGFQAPADQPDSGPAPNNPPAQPPAPGKAEATSTISQEK